jgi:hypothetical protein
MISARGSEAAATEATHEQILNHDVLGLVVAWQILPERETADL